MHKFCKSKDKTTVEFALRENQQPIGVSTYQVQSQLPDELKGKLPTVEQLEMELSNAVEDIADNDENENPG